MITIAIVICVLCSIHVSAFINICPNGTRSAVIVPYQQIDTDSVEDSTLRMVINSYLTNIQVGISSENLAVSCKQIAELKPYYSSGNYFIQGEMGAVGVYCEMNNEFNETGGWMRIANVDMRNNNSQCPPGLVYNFASGKRFCREVNLGCSLITFATNGVEYNKVCGKVIGYQYGDTYGFGPARFTPGIDQTYVDGVGIITNGTPKQHVWTFAAAIAEVDSSIVDPVNCPCLHPSVPFRGTIPSFVGNDYYCETGRGRGTVYTPGRYYFDDPLWDGEGCAGENACCDRGGPWFCKQLPRPTRGDIELKVCKNNGNEEVGLEQIELYVQ